jgi:hypothetical protein
MIDLMTLESALIAAVISLAGAVAVLFGSLKAHYRRLERKLDECERDRAKLWTELAAVKVQLATRKV